MKKGVEVTVKDLENGDTDSEVIWDDYVIITAGNRYIDGIQYYANGTAVITVKKKERA